MNIVIVGSGIAGMSAAIEAANRGISVTLLSSHYPERAQSVMAAGGINAVLSTENGDSIESHVNDTYKGGVFLEDTKTLEYFCQNAPDNIAFLESLGVMFNRDKNNNPCQRAFGGQSHRRTVYSGSSTGKQIVTALIRKCREFEAKGLINRVTGEYFHSALIKDGFCNGVIMCDPFTGELKPYFGHAVIIATGGQNVLFGKTTGTSICDGYTTAKLFSQGVTLRNLEFIQYHPTTIETSHKRMLITEAARGEGGRLYYLKDNKRIYFMEDLYGENGNLMPRDIVAKCIYDCPSQVYLDISFLGKELIMERLLEVYDLCMEYIGIDVTKESIPVYPSVHFFMGGIAVDIHHETNIKNLYASGECASMYHGANRLGGNSLLAAVHSGREAAKSIHEKINTDTNSVDDLVNECTQYINSSQEEIERIKNSNSTFPTAYILQDIATIMNKDLGITRNEADLQEGISQIDYYLDTLTKIKFDPDVSLYENYRLFYLVLLSKAILLCAKERKETRGAHIRTDYPDTMDEFKKCTYVNFKNNTIEISFE